MGAVRREVDTRSTEQLLANIDYFADKLPEVAQFKNELKDMNPKHLGIVSDICELGSTTEMLPTAINMRKPASNGKSLLAALIEKLPKASKENPKAVEFAGEVINQTDSTASKYFLGCFVGAFEHPEVAQHFAATKPLIKGVAEATLSGGYLMDYSKEQKFVNFISNYINPSVNPENIKIINETYKAVENLPKNINLNCYGNSNNILHSQLPAAQMRENLKTFEQIAEGLSQKTDKVDLVAFLTRNVNLD